MKQVAYFTFLLFFGFAISACQGDQSSSSATDTAAAPAATTPAATPPPVTATGAVDHYTCPNGHPGAPAAGNCIQCGTTLVHNQAFHANDAVTPAANSNPMQQFAPAAAAANSTTTSTTITPGANQAAPSPAQNAAGVYHYTCSAGCAGGAGAAGTCANCGGALAHNQAYHN